LKLTQFEKSSHLSLSLSSLGLHNHNFWTRLKTDGSKTVLFTPFMSADQYKEMQTSETVGDPDKVVKGGDKHVVRQVAGKDEFTGTQRLAMSGSPSIVSERGRMTGKFDNLELRMADEDRMVPSLVVVDRSGKIDKDNSEKVIADKGVISFDAQGRLNKGRMDIGKTNFEIAEKILIEKEIKQQAPGGVDMSITVTEESFNNSSDSISKERLKEIKKQALKTVVVAQVDGKTILKIETGTKKDKEIKAAGFGDVIEFVDIWVPVYEEYAVDTKTGDFMTGAEFRKERWDAWNGKEGGGAFTKYGRLKDARPIQDQGQITELTNWAKINSKLSDVQANENASNAVVGQDQDGNIIAKMKVGERTIATSKGKYVSKSGKKKAVYQYVRLGGETKGSLTESSGVANLDDVVMALGKIDENTTYLQQGDAIVSVKGDRVQIAAIKPEESGRFYKLIRTETGDYLEGALNQDASRTYYLLDTLVGNEDNRLIVMDAQTGEIHREGQIYLNDLENKREITINPHQIYNQRAGSKLGNFFGSTVDGIKAEGTHTGFSIALMDMGLNDATARAFDGTNISGLGAATSLLMGYGLVAKGLLGASAYF